jgi:hypothetical protein
MPCSVCSSNGSKEKTLSAFDLANAGKIHIQKVLNYHFERFFYFLFILQKHKTQLQKWFYPLFNSVGTEIGIREL